MTWESDELIAKCIKCIDLLNVCGVCLLSYLNSLPPFFPFVKKILVIEIMNRFWFCFDSIKINKRRNLFIMSAASSLWKDTPIHDWIPERCSQETAHWTALYEQFFNFFLNCHFGYVHCYQAILQALSCQHFIITCYVAKEMLIMFIYCLFVY